MHEECKQNGPQETPMHGTPSRNHTQQSIEAPASDTPCRNSAQMHGLIETVGISAHSTPCKNVTQLEVMVYHTLDSDISQGESDLSHKTLSVSPKSSQHCNKSSPLRIKEETTSSFDSSPKGKKALHHSCTDKEFLGTPHTPNRDQPASNESCTVSNDCNIVKKDTPSPSILSPHHIPDGSTRNSYCGLPGTIRDSKLPLYTSTSNAREEGLYECTDFNENSENDKTEPDIVRQEYEEENDAIYDLPKVVSNPADKGGSEAAAMYHRLDRPRDQQRVSLEGSNVVYNALDISDREKKIPKDSSNKENQLSLLKNNEVFYHTLESNIMDDTEPLYDCTNFDHHKNDGDTIPDAAGNKEDAVIYDLPHADRSWISTNKGRGNEGEIENGAKYYNLASRSDPWETVVSKDETTEEDEDLYHRLNNSTKEKKASTESRCGNTRSENEIVYNRLDISTRELQTLKEPLTSGLDGNTMSENEIFYHTLESDDDKDNKEKQSDATTGHGNMEEDTAIYDLPLAERSWNSIGDRRGSGGEESKTSNGVTYYNLVGRTAPQVTDDSLGSSRVKENEVVPHTVDSSTTTEIKVSHKSASIDDNIMKEKLNVAGSHTRKEDDVIDLPQFETERARNGDEIEGGKKEREVDGGPRGSGGGGGGGGKNSGRIHSYQI